MKVLLKISYLGTNYHGWQVQPNGAGSRSRPSWLRLRDRIRHELLHRTVAADRVAQTEKLPVGLADVQLAGGAAAAHRPALGIAEGRQAALRRAHGHAVAAAVAHGTDDHAAGDDLLCIGRGRRRDGVDHDGRVVQERGAEIALRRVHRIGQTCLHV